MQHGTFLVLVIGSCISATLLPTFGINDVCCRYHKGVSLFSSSQFLYSNLSPTNPSNRLLCTNYNLESIAALNIYVFEENPIQIQMGFLKVQKIVYVIDLFDFI